MSEKMSPGHQREFEVLKRLFSPLFCTSCESLNILYVGASPGHVFFAPQMKAAGHHMSLLEIDSDAANQLHDTDLFDYIKIGDVRSLARQRYPVTPDVVFWRYGPEHVELEFLKPIAQAMEKLAKHIVIMVTVHGPTSWYKPDVEAHPSMRHLSVQEPKHYIDLGYHTEIIPSGTGKLRGDGAQLVAWKWTGTWKWPSKSRS